MNRGSDDPPENPTSTQIGGAVRQLRIQRGLTIEELANTAGVHSTYLSGIERGRRNPSWEMIRSIVNALEIEAVDLVRLAGSVAEPTRRQRRP